MNAPRSLLREEDHTIGPEAAATVLVEYGDYECPFCRRDQPGLERLLGQEGDRVRFSFRHFPIVAEHPNAERAARTAEAADLQGRFWPMHEQLMRWAGPLEDEALAACAEAAGLSLDRLWADVERPEVARRVERDIELGRGDGVRGTPWYLLDGARAGPLAAIAKQLRSAPDQPDGGRVPR